MSQDSAAAAAVERLQAAVVDGTTENVRYRQDQLQALHGALREEVSAIRRGLAKDSLATAVEVETEFYLTMEAVQHFYDGLHFKRELEDEYRVANGRDNADRRVGLGLVVIRPTSHTRLYSIITPLAAAIAAGNCIILELQDTLLEVDSILRSLLPKALDINTFCVAKKIIDKSILESAILVDQTTEKPSSSLTTQLLSSSGVRTVAIVDRTADIELAAKAITTARFSLGGTSPYAPDLVLVNEFVKQPFFEACSKYATLSFARESSLRKVSGNQNEEFRKAVKEAEEKRQVSSFGSHDFKLVDILDKATPIMKMKVSGRYLPIATFTSLVDAIFNHDFEVTLLAGYFFAEPAGAKYLSQHLPCHISLINTIPAHLLLGPAAPIAHAPDYLHRYNTEMFSVSRPQFVEARPEPFGRAEALLSGGKEVSTASIRALAAKPLKPTGQPKNDLLGFFEQGFLIGASITLSVVLPILGYTAWTLGRKGLDLFAKYRR